jgi:hypothetical protein
VYGYLFAQAFNGDFGDVQALVSAGNLGVRFAVECYSGYALFAALEGSVSADLTAAAGRIVAAGASAYDVAVGMVPADPLHPGSGMPGPPKFGAALDHEAFIRLLLVAGSAGTFLATAAAIDDVVGACLTAGAYSALVEVATDSFLDLTTAIAAVGEISGVTVQSTALAYLGT